MYSTANEESSQETSHVQYSELLCLFDKKLERNVEKKLSKFSWISLSLFI